MLVTQGMFQVISETGNAQESEEIMLGAHGETHMVLRHTYGDEGAREAQAAGELLAWSLAVGP